MGYSSDRFNAYEEMTTAMAQSTIQQAMNDAGLSDADLARRLGVNRRRVVQVKQRNMTMRMFARVLAACGYEVRFRLVKKGQTHG